MTTGGYNNIEVQSVVCTKYGGGVGGTNQSQKEVLPAKGKQS